jgi:hypothetical protein
MSDTYTSGPFKGLSKQEIKRTRQIIKDRTGKTATNKQISFFLIEGEDSLDMNKGGIVKSRTGPQDFRNGGMVISTVDNRKNK